MLATCVFTVPTPTTSSAAISAFESPRASSVSTSSSRGVSSSSATASVPSGGPPWANCSITRRVTAGSRSAAPPAITLIAAISSSGAEFFSRKPLAPARRRLVDVLVEVEGGEDDDARGAVAGENLAGRREAVHPRHADVHQRHVRGEAARRRDRLLPVPGLGDDLHVGLGLDDHPEAAPDHRLVVGDQDPDHAPATHSGRPSSGRRARTSWPWPPGRRPDPQVAAVEADPLTHADDPVAAGRGTVGGRGAGPVVADHDLDLARLPPHQHLGAAIGSSVLPNVRQRFLDDPVDRQVEPRRQRRAVALDTKLDREAGAPRLLDQLAQPRDSGLRRQR